MNQYKPRQQHLPGVDPPPVYDPDTGEELIPVAYTAEQKRFLMGLLKKAINHYNLHLNSIKGKYLVKDHIEYQAHLAYTSYQLLNKARTLSQRYREAKGL